MHYKAFFEFYKFQIENVKRTKPRSMNRSDVISTTSPIVLYPEKLIFVLIHLTPTLIVRFINFTLTFTANVPSGVLSKVIVYSITISRLGQRFTLSTAERKTFTAPSNTRMSFQARVSLYPHKKILLLFLIYDTKHNITSSLRQIN